MMECLGGSRLGTRGPRTCTGREDPRQLPIPEISADEPLPRLRGGRGAVRAGGPDQGIHYRGGGIPEDSLLRSAPRRDRTDGGGEVTFETAGVLPDRGPGRSDRYF